MAGRFAVGARVDGLYDGNSDDVWYPGVIHAAHDDETFDVLYDDGEAEYHVRTQFLRAHQRGTICVGTRVFGRYASGDEWYPGKIQEALEDGTFTVEYDDGEVEVGLAMDRIRESMTDDTEEAAPVDGGSAQAIQADDEETAATSGDITTEPEDTAHESEPVNAAGEEAARQEEAASVEELRPHEAAEPVETEDNASVVGSSLSHVVEDPELVPVAPREGVIDPMPTPQENQYELPPREAPARRKSKSRPQSSPTEAAEEPTNAVLDNAQSVDEYANILSTMEQLESYFADALTTKTLLSTLVKQMRAFPQATADLVHTRSGEALLIDILKRHHAHAVIQCYGFVLLRRLCFLCGKSTHYFLRNGIIELVTIAMRKFAEDAILQASACGALAVFTRVHAGLTALLENRVSHLVLATIIFHKTYSVHTRQVHYYACEVLLELCELGDKTTIEALCGDSMSGPGLSDLSPVSLLLFLLRQALSFDDKKACCAVGTLLMCLASCHRHAAQMVLDLNGLSELSTVMAKYPMEPGIQKYAASASREIAMCSMEQPSPTQRRVQNAAHDLLGESNSMEDLQQHRLQQHRQGANAKSKVKSSTGTSKRKAPQQHGHGVSNLNGFPSPSHQQHLGAMTGSGRDALSFSKYTSPIGKAPHLPPNIRAFNGTAPSPSSLQYQQQQQQQQYPQRNQVGSPLVILDGLGHGGSEKKKFMKEERHNLLFETYGVDAKAALHQPPAGDHHVRTQGIKRRQLKTHIVAATGGDGSAISWASPVKAVILKDTKPLTSRSDKHGVNTTASMAAGSDSRKTRSSGGQASHHDDDSEELSPATLRRQQAQEKAKKREKESDDKTPRSSSFRLKLDSSNTAAAAGTTGMVSPIAVSPKSGRGGAGATKSTTKAKKTGTQPAPVSSRVSGGDKTASNESLNSYAAQLFKDEMQAPAASPTANAAAIKTAQERERLSFAEKLHKMIDKAKSSLAHGSTVSLVADSPVKASTKRPNNGNSASVKKKPASTPTASTSRVVPTSVKPVASVSTPNKDATAAQKRPMAASVKPVPPKKPVAVVASTPVAKPSTPSTKPIMPVLPKATKIDGVAPSRPAPAANKSGSASVRPKPTSAASKAPASTSKSTTEKKAEKKASSSSAAATAMAGAAVLAASTAAAVVLTADEKEAETTRGGAKTKEEDIPLSQDAGEEGVPSPEQGEQADESKADQVLTTGNEVRPEPTDTSVESADNPASAEAVTEHPSTLSVEDAVTSPNPTSDQSAETHEEIAPAEADTSSEEKTAEATVAEAAAVVAAASAADDLYADEYNDFDDLDGGDNAPQTLDDDAMGRDNSFEALMNLTSQVTTRQEDDGIPQFSVAAPVPVAAVEEPKVLADEVVATVAESGVADTRENEATDSPPDAEGDTVSAPATDSGNAGESEDAVTGAEVAEPEPMTSGKYDHAEEVGSLEEDDREQPDDIPPASESEPTPPSEATETPTSSDEQPSPSEEAAPVAASDDTSSSMDEANAVEPANSKEPEQNTGDSGEAEESIPSECTPDNETQEEVLRAETPSSDERPESRQTDMSYGEEDFEDTPEDAGDETLPNTTEEETASLFEPAEAPTFEPATEKEYVEGSAADPLQAEPADERPIDAASEEEEAVAAVKQVEVELEKDENSSSAVEVAAITDTVEVVATDAAHAAEPDLADEQVVGPEGDEAHHDDESFGNLDASQTRDESCSAPEVALEIPTGDNATSDAPQYTTETEANTTATSVVVIEGVATTADRERGEEATTTEQHPETDEAAVLVEPSEVPDVLPFNDTSEASSGDEPSNSHPVAPTDDDSGAPPANIGSPSEEEPRVATPDVYSEAEFASEDVGDSANGASAHDPEPVEAAEELREGPPPDAEIVALPNEEDRAVTPDVYSEAEFGGDEAVPGEQEQGSEDAGSMDSAPVVDPVQDDEESKPSPVEDAASSQESQEETTTMESPSERVATPDAYAQDEEFEDEPHVEEAKDVATTPHEPLAAEPDVSEPAADGIPVDLPLSDPTPTLELSSAELAADDTFDVPATLTERAQNDGDVDPSPQAIDQGKGSDEAVSVGDDVVPVADESAVEASSIEDHPVSQSADDATPPVESEPEQSNEDAELPPVETEVVEDRADTPDGYADADFGDDETYPVPDATSDDKVDDTAVEQPHEDLASDDGKEPVEMRAAAQESELLAERATTPEAYGDDGDFKEQTIASETRVDAVDSDPQREGMEPVSVVDQVKTDSAPAESGVADEESDGVQPESGGVDVSAARDEDAAVDAETSALREESTVSSELTPAEHEPQTEESPKTVVDVRPVTPEEENSYEDDTTFGDDGDQAEPPQPATESSETSVHAASIAETETAEQPSPTAEEDAAPEPPASAAEEVDVTNAAIDAEPSVEEQHEDTSEPSSEELAVETAEPSSDQSGQVERDELLSEATESPVDAVCSEMPEPAAYELHEANAEPTQDEEAPQSVTPELNEVAADPVPEPPAEIAAAPENTQDEAHADEYAFDEEAAAPASATTEMEVSASPRTAETAGESSAPLAEEVPGHVEETTGEPSTQVEERPQGPADSEEAALKLTEHPEVGAIEKDEPTDKPADKIEVSEEEPSAATEIPSEEEVQAAPVADSAPESEPPKASDLDDGVTVASPEDITGAETPSATDPDSEPPASAAIVDGEADQPQSTPKTPRSEEIDGGVATEKSASEEDEAAASDVAHEEDSERESAKHPGEEQEAEVATAPESTEELPANAGPSASSEIIPEHEAEESKEPAKTDDAADEYAFDDDTAADQATPEDEAEEDREPVVEAASSEEKPPTESVSSTDDTVEHGAEDFSELTEVTDDTVYDDEENEFEEPKVDAPELITTAEPSPISSSAPSPPPSDDVDYEDFEPDEPPATAAAAAQPVEAKPTASAATEEAYADETEDDNDFEEDAEVTTTTVAAPVAPMATVKKEDEEVEADDAYEAEEGFEDDDNDAKTTIPPRIQAPVVNTAAATPSVAAAAVKASSPSTPTAEEDADNDYEAEYDEFED